MRNQKRMFTETGDLTKEMGDAITQWNKDQYYKHEQLADMPAMNNDIDGEFELNFILINGLMNCKSKTSF